MQRITITEIQFHVRDIVGRLSAHTRKIASLHSQKETSEAMLETSKLSSYVSDCVTQFTNPVINKLYAISIDGSIKSDLDLQKVISDLISNIFKLKQELTAVGLIEYHDAYEVILLNKKTKQIELLVNVILEICLKNQVKLDALLLK